MLYAAAGLPLLPVPPDPEPLPPEPPLDGGVGGVVDGGVEGGVVGLVGVGVFAVGVVFDGFAAFPPQPNKTAVMHTTASIRATRDIGLSPAELERA